MAIKPISELFTYGDHSFSVGIQSPIPGVTGSKDPAGKIFRAIVSKLASETARITECINYALELDGEAYTVAIIGTPIELSRVDGTHSGFTISITVLPGFTIRDNEEVR